MERRSNSLAGSILKTSRLKAMRNLPSVITSYSIHYTKLYDRNCAFKTYDSRCCFPVELDIWCSIEERRDKRSVIFIESDADNFGDDE